MKKMIIVFAGLLFAGLSTFAQKTEDLKGIWLNEQKDIRLEIYEKDHKFYGRIIGGNGIYETDGKTIKQDKKNPSASQQSRSMFNLIILSDYSYNDGEWTGGTIYDPKSGKTYKGKMKLVQGRLEIRGYLGSPMFGKTATWTRSS